eukprot:TRINITY_DN55786_c0_g1_i1.p1 TRINITY_DN55786_c0_g1~~TRINITY_DN55786_c0_g1_i1.p1  ORF type:complete len:359 (-),score=44.16 TRINITY_DN55786_c0_g1_i1:72-1148(-)
MTSTGDYQLYWYDMCVDANSQGTCPHQFVFTTRSNVPANLFRVRTVQDMLKLLPGGESSAPTVVVVLAALLCGNLIARGDWQVLTAIIVAGLSAAVLQLKIVRDLLVLLLVVLFFQTLVRGLVCWQWFGTVSMIILIVWAAEISIGSVVHQDPRSYVLLQDEVSDSAIIRNRCCMDVKLLIFDGDDLVRMIPRNGGLFGGTLVRRDGSICAGSEPPYFVKVFSPFWKELGTFVVECGTYSFRATVPPFVVRQSDSPRFTNSTETMVTICICNEDHWTSSLWLPSAGLVARLLHKGHKVPSQQEQAVPGNCCLRVYTGFLGSSEVAHCFLRQGERAEFVGSITWSRDRLFSSKTTRVFR